MATAARPKSSAKPRRPNSQLQTRKSTRQPDIIVAYEKLNFDVRHDVIGRGAFATVYKARHVDWGCYVAYKKLNVNVDHDFASGAALRFGDFVGLGRRYWFGI